MTNEQYTELQKRNAVRLEEAKKTLGTKYLLHPNNAVKKIKKDFLS